MDISNRRIQVHQIDNNSLLGLAKTGILNSINQLSEKVIDVDAIKSVFEDKVVHQPSKDLPQGIQKILSKSFKYEPVYTAEYIESNLLKLGKFLDSEEQYLKNKINELKDMLNKIEDANTAYKSGNVHPALEYYTSSLYYKPKQQTPKGTLYRGILMGDASNLQQKF